MEGDAREPRTTPHTGKALGQPHLCDIIPGQHAGLPASREVAEHPESISGTALVGIHPVLSCRGGGGELRPKKLFAPYPQPSLHAQSLQPLLSHQNP